MTTQHLSLLLERPGEEMRDLSCPTLVIMFLWRYANPHSLSQALLTSLLLNGSKKWLEVARTWVSLPLVAICLLSLAWVSHVRANAHWAKMEHF